MTSPRYTVTRLDLPYEDWDWPFARDNRNAIEAHFSACRVHTPELFNGAVLLGRNPQFSDDAFSASFFRTDFASFLAWRDWGFPDTSIFNGFAAGALRCADGAFVLGEMAAHTANAGKVYFPAGTPDLDDLRDGYLDMAENIRREVAEEVGFSPDHYREAAQWRCIVDGSRIALIRILELPDLGTCVKVRIEDWLAGQTMPELSRIHLVRQPADVIRSMPEFVKAFLAEQLPD